MNRPHEPLVSVVIPTIRFDTYTHKAIRSIFAQTYRNWEILLVLDGCSVEEVPEYLTRHPQCRLVVHHQRLGTPTSLNDGVIISKGQLIARLDADDIAHPERLKTQVEFMRSHPEICCVGTNGILIDSTGNYLGSASAKNDNLDVRRGLLNRNMLTHSSVMYRKDIFEEIGGYNATMIRMQDYDLYLRMAQMGPLAVLGDRMCAYRTHPGQHSRNTSPFRPYTFEVLRQRLLLGEYFEVPRTLQYFKNVAWYSAQVLRHLSLRKPRYLTKATSVPEEKEGLDWIDPVIP